jgi:hypothetical protein
MKGVAGLLTGKAVVVGYPVFWTRGFERSVEALSVFVERDEARDRGHWEGAGDCRAVDGYPFRGSIVIR